MMIPLRALVIKDLRLFFADRRAVIMSFLAPILIASFFGYVFGGNGTKSPPSRISVLIFDEDGSAISRGILTDLMSNKSLNVKSADATSARADVQAGKAAVAVEIPKNFGADAGRAFFQAAQKPEIHLLYDPSHAAEQGMLQGILTGSVMQVVSREMFGGASGQDMVAQSLQQIEQSRTMPVEEKETLRGLLQSVDRWNRNRGAQGGSGTVGSGSGGGLSMPAQIHDEAVTARADVVYNSYAHSFGGMSVQFILFMGIDVGVNLLLQKQRGLWKRLRAAPLSRGLLLGSRALSAGLISMLILLVVFGFARVVFGVRIEGSMAGFIGVAVAFSLMTSAFGLLVAAVGKTPEATRGLSVLVTLIMVMLGGAWVPSFIFPQWLQNVTLFVPTRWAMDGFDGMTWRGLGFASAVGPIGALLLAALVFGVLAAVRFRWEVDA